MEMKGEQRIAASREKVWAALNDPEVLKAAIPGCDSLETTSAHSFKAQVTAKVGPVKAKFAGEVTLSDIDPPNGYTISGEGKGGAVGFAKGGATVALVEDGSDTLLSYDVKANVGGKLAQLGARLIDGTAKKMADDFFGKFGDLAANYQLGDAPVEAVADSVPEPKAEKEAEAPAVAPVSEPEDAGGGLPVWIWAAGLVVIVVIGLLIFG